MQCGPCAANEIAYMSKFMHCPLEMTIFKFSRYMTAMHDITERHLVNGTKHLQTLVSK